MRIRIFRNIDENLICTISESLLAVLLDVKKFLIADILETRRLLSNVVKFSCTVFIYMSNLQGI